MIPLRIPHSSSSQHCSRPATDMQLPSFSEPSLSFAQAELKLDYKLSHYGLA
jgi:hypothetical protein